MKRFHYRKMFAIIKLYHSLMQMNVCNNTDVPHQHNFLIIKFSSTRYS